MKLVIYTFFLLLLGCVSAKKKPELKIYVNQNLNTPITIKFKTDPSSTVKYLDNTVDLCNQSHFKGVLITDTSTTSISIYLRKNCLNKTYTVLHDIITIDLNDKDILIQNTNKNHLINDREAVIQKLISIIKNDNKNLNTFLLSWSPKTTIKSYHLLLEILNVTFNKMNTENSDYLPNIIISDFFVPPLPPKE
jgi:hypothetical protein